MPEKSYWKNTARMFPFTVQKYAWKYINFLKRLRSVMYQKCFNTFVYWGLGCLVFNQGGIREQVTKKKLASRNHICKTINNLIWKVNSDLKSVHSFFFVSVCTVCIFFQAPCSFVKNWMHRRHQFSPSKQKVCNGPFNFF